MCNAGTGGSAGKGSAVGDNADAVFGSGIAGGDSGHSAEGGAGGSGGASNGTETGNTSLLSAKSHSNESAGGGGQRTGASGTDGGGADDDASGADADGAGPAEDGDAAAAVDSNGGEIGNGAAAAAAATGDGGTGSGGGAGGGYRRGSVAERRGAIPAVQLLQPYATEHLPVNVKVLLIRDVDGDGKNELIVGKTDRIVIAYRWVGASNQLKRLWSSQLPGQIGSMALVNTEHGLAIAVSQPGATFMLVDGKTGEATHAPIATSWASGSSVQGAATEIIGPITEHKAPSRATSACDLTSMSSAAAPAGTQKDGGIAASLPSSLEPTEDAQPLPQPSHTPELFASCTSAGLLTLGTTSAVKWELQIDGQLFALCKLQCTNRDAEEVVACAWDGLTCIVDMQGNVVRFDLGQEVCGFIAGMYAVEPGENVPCLIYVTLTESEINPSKILVYHDVKLNTVAPPPSLVTMLSPELTKYVDVLEKTGLKGPSSAATTKALVRHLRTLSA